MLIQFLMSLFRLIVRGNHNLPRKESILHWISMKYDRYYFCFIYALHDLPESHFEMEAN
jgi:hypothetical protein